MAVLSEVSGQLVVDVAVEEMVAVARIWMPGIANDYERLWLSTGARAYPSEISEEVIPTIPIHPGYENVREMQGISNTAALGVLLVSIGPPSEPDLWHIVAARVRWNEAAPAILRTVSMALVDAGGTEITLAQREIGTTGSPATGLALHRPIIVPMGFQLRGRIDSLPAVNALTIEAFFLVKNPAEELPPF